MLSSLAKQTIFIAWVIWIELLWLYAIVALLCSFLFMSVIDTVLWFYIAKTRWATNSKSGSDWLLSKFIWFIVLWWATAIAWSIAFTIASPWLTTVISIWIWSAILLRNWYEAVSLLENLNIISSSTDKKFIGWLLKYLNKIIWITQDTIDQKANRYKQT